MSAIPRFIDGILTFLEGKGKGSAADAGKAPESTQVQHHRPRQRSRVAGGRGAARGTTCRTPPMVLRVCYEMSGTDVSYTATAYYAFYTCPVLTSIRLLHCRTHSLLHMEYQLACCVITAHGACRRHVCRVPT
eukprot:3790796-Rhodomonas_salina.1